MHWRTATEERVRAQNAVNSTATEAVPTPHSLLARADGTDSRMPNSESTLHDLFESRLSCRHGTAALASAPAATSSARTASRARMRRGSWRSAPCAGRRSSRRCVFIYRLVMKEVRRKKEERGKGRVQSSRVLGRTVVPRVFGLARLVRPLWRGVLLASSQI